MYKDKFFTLFLLIGLALGVTLSSSHAKEVSTTAETSSETELEHNTYIDPRFDFSVEYPADWSVQHREDRPGFVGGTVGFSAPASSQNSAKVEIGFYFVERNPSQPIDAWSKIYDTNYDIEPNRILVLNEEKFGIVQEGKSREAFRKAAVSPLTEYTYVNVPWGKTVLFFWMNSIDEEDQAILDDMVRSVRFGENAPVTLRGAFGRNFQPLPLEVRSPDNKQRHDFPEWNSEMFSTDLVTSVSTDYIIPVSDSAGISCGPPY